MFSSKFKDHLLCLLLNSNKRENAEWYCPWKKISISKAQRHILCRLGFSIADNTHRFQRGGYWSVAPTFFHFLGKVGWKIPKVKLDIDKIYTGSKNLSRRRAKHACRGEAKGEHLSDVLSAQGASQRRWTCAIHPKLPTNHQQKHNWPFRSEIWPVEGCVALNLVLGSFRQLENFKFTVMVEAVLATRSQIWDLVPIGTSFKKHWSRSADLSAGRTPGG